MGKRGGNGAKGGEQGREGKGRSKEIWGRGRKTQRNKGKCVMIVRGK